MPAPLTESDIFFPNPSADIKGVLSELKRSNLSIANRLRSIAQDSEFVTRVAIAYQLPLIANERCGSWYIPTDVKEGSAYFKSTDGHFGQWSFSQRRLNLQILEVIAKAHGCIIVDSTRRGKSIPDALSKTVPIWVAVLNRLLFPENPTAHELRTPEDVVSRSEHSQITARIPGFVRDIEQLQLDVAGLKVTIGYPMFPVWLRPGDDVYGLLPTDSEVHPIVLCTASSCPTIMNHHSSGYVQGAADDHEVWACGLTPALFWANKDCLLDASEDELPGLIESLIAAKVKEGRIQKPVLLQVATGLWITTNDAAERLGPNFAFVLSCSEAASASLTERSKDRYVHFRCGSGKNGSRQLRSELPKLDGLLKRLQPLDRILVSCESGKDLAVGVALAMLCRRYDSDGCPMECLTGEPDQSITKVLIKQRLSWIMVSMPDAAPSRATLQSVNAYLMS